MSGGNYLISLPFSHEDMDPEEFFSRLNKLSDGTGNPPFGVLCRFMQTLLCLPHSNVNVERIFSDVSAKKKSSKTENSPCHLKSKARCERLWWMYKIFPTFYISII